MACSRWSCLHFVSQLLYLAFEFSFLGVVWLETVWPGCGVVAHHRGDTYEQAHAQYAFEHSLPEGADWLFPGWRIIFGHENN
jgi:hypothetical protein